MVKAQEWLDKNYPKEERNKVKEIYLNELSLEGELDLGGFTCKNDAKVYICPKVDETKLTFKNLPEKAQIVKLVQVQEYVNQKYPTQEEREKETGLYISEKSLQGDLDLSDFINLKILDCRYNKLTSLKLNNCSQMEWIHCRDNLLTSLALPINPTNLKHLSLGDNDFPSRDLSFLVPYANLEELYLYNNNFTGSLDHLSGMEKLKILDIKNTDINKVNITKLPTSLENIYYSTEARPDCKLTEIVPQLEKYENEWKNIHSDFTLELRRGWEKQGFDKEQTRAWLSVYKLKVDEYKEAGEYKKKDFTFDQIKKELKRSRIEKNSHLLLAIPSERLFVIRSNIKKFISKWGKKEENKNRLSKLQDPQQFQKSELLTEGAKWTARGMATTGGILALTGQPIAGGVMAAASPFVEAIASEMKERVYERNKTEWYEFTEDTEEFLDNYNELLGLTKSINVVEGGVISAMFRKLKDKVEEFLKEHDHDGNGTIDVEELINDRVKLNKKLDELEEMVKLIKKLENKVISYRQGILDEETEKTERQLMGEELTTTQNIPISKNPGQKIKEGIKDWWTDFQTKLTAPISEWECCQEPTKKDKGKAVVREKGVIYHEISQEVQQQTQIEIPPK